LIAVCFLFTPIWAISTADLAPRTFAAKLRESRRAIGCPSRTSSLKSTSSSAI
jgi:hypothetical protein